MEPEQIELFLRELPHGYVCTVSRDGWPAGALVGFSANSQLEVMFGTDEISRKAVNLAANPKVCFVTTEVNQRYQVQIWGVARRLRIDEYNARRIEHYRKLPTSERFEGEPGQAFYVIKPSIVVFRDCNLEHSRDWRVWMFTRGAKNQWDVRSMSEQEYAALA